MSKSILMVVTTASELKGGHETGLWLSEFGEAYAKFKEFGYSITVVSPNGGDVPIDPNSLGDDVPQEILDTKQYLKGTQPIDDIGDGSEFDAVFLPGGHGTVIDFPENRKLQNLLRDMYEANKVVASVCHGPAGLVGVTLSDGKPLVKGKTVTAFTDAEESEMGLDETVPFLLESKLLELGANFKADGNWSDHVEADGHLVTGQNPQSTESVAKEVVRQLNN
ncbi:glutamine amidotransferase [Halalkalibacillus sediminis]|uniref:Glutamine amidotransferase n=1 Tax=Halalkalibacillus sediminis TaxID=2018042 RepID=A0A2I0QTF8_9BACI|nr:type 1 glutamine amidotransferase domain-containing protein [Halalkalibacillus sediminis]PKR77635.1 glutamine amidotransferase [Halalkalibacillus sediminis]